MTWQWSFLDWQWSCFLYSVRVPRILHLPQNPTPSHHVVIKDYNFRSYRWNWCFFSASPIPEQIHGVAICRRRDQVHIDLCGPAYGTFCRSRGFTLPGKELTLEAKLHRSHRVKSSEAGHRSWFRTLSHQKDRLLSSPKGIGWDWWWGSRDHMNMSVVLKGFVFLETPHLRLAQLFVLARRTLHYIHCVDRLLTWHWILVPNRTFKTCMFVYEAALLQH